MYPITGDLKETLYKLNIPFFRDPSLPAEAAPKVAPVSAPIPISIQSSMETPPVEEEKVVH